MAIAIATGLIDRAEHRIRIVDVHERARPIVDGLARDAHVVGVHHAMDETHKLPLRNQLGLTQGHGAQELRVAL